MAASPRGPRTKSKLWDWRRSRGFREEEPALPSSSTSNTLEESTSPDDDWTPDQVLRTGIWKDIPVLTDPPSEPMIEEELFTKTAPIDRSLLFRTSDKLIQFQDNARHRYQLKASSLHCLIFTLCDRGGSKSQYEDFSRTFFCTYRSFSDPEELFAKLVSLLRASPPLAEPIFRLFRHWFLTWFTEWSSSMKSQLEELIAEFKQTAPSDEQILHLSLSSSGCSLGNMNESNRLGIAVRFLEKTYQQKCGKGTYKSMFAGDASIDLKSLPPSQFHPRFEASRAWDQVSFFDLDDFEVARQFTIRSSHFYAETQPVEFLDQAWSKEHLKEKAPNLLGLIQNFNRIAAITCTLILHTEKLKQRIRMLTKLIDIAYHCYELSNFDGTMAILSGLSSSPIHRLKYTRESLSKESLAKLQRLRDLFNPTGSFSNYRQVLSTRSPPCIPFVGVYLTDLTFIEDGNKTLLASGHINFFKCLLVAGVIQQVLAFKQVPYQLRLIPAFHRYIEKLPILTEDQRFDLSTQLEPRGASKKEVK